VADRPVSGWGWAYLIFGERILDLALRRMAIGPEILLNRLKPGVSIRTHRIAAASIWTVVGISLMIRGGVLLLETC